MAAKLGKRSKYEGDIRLEMDLKQALGLAECPVIQCAADIATVFKKLSRLEREVMIAGALDCKCRLIRWSLLAVGSTHMVSVRIGDAFQDAVKTGAMGIFLVHNHPSGSLEPSNEDRNLTNQAKEAGWLLGYPLLDHVIISKSGHRSLMPNGIKKLAGCLSESPMTKAAESGCAAGV